MVRFPLFSSSIDPPTRAIQQADVRPLIWLMMGVWAVIPAGCMLTDSSPHVWIGTAPFCSADRQDCDILGLDYVRSSTSGDGLPCLRGQKVLCEAPKIDASPATSDRLTSFTVVQYNIMDRPFWIGHDGQRERVCRIPQALAQGIASREPVDVVVINEGFVGVCVGRLRLTDLLAHYGWRYHLPPLNAWWKPSNGGIFIVSKWPILASAEMTYQACRGADCLAAKGVQYARLEKTVAGGAKRYHVFATHMQAWGGTAAMEVRRQQARELAAFIARQDIPPTEPVLLAGDLNTRGPGNQVFEELLATFKMTMPTMVGERRATMDVDNTLFGRGPWLVDYVLPSLAHQQPVQATLEVVALRAREEFAMCAAAPLQPFYVPPYASTCARTIRVRDLSDHYPVIGRFAFAE